MDERPVGPGPTGIVNAVLRAATEDDLDVMLDWRNHPQVRKVSMTTHAIGVEEHRRWWNAVEKDPTRQVLIYSFRGVPAGVVTFSDHDVATGTATWGFYLDTAGLDERDELLRAWMELEREAIGYAFDVLKLKTLGGATLAWNQQVLALHRRFGFAETRRYAQEVDGVTQEVVWTELSAGARRR